MQRKTIWFVSQTTMPPQYESRLRIVKFAQYLQKAGYDVTLFTSSVLHNMDVDLIEDDSEYIIREYDGLRYVHIKGLHYSKTSKYKRALGMLAFTRRFIKIANKLELPKPDVLVGGGVPFGIFTIRYAHKHGIKNIMQVQDLWPFTFTEVGIVSKDSLLLPPLYAIEKWLYKHTDALVFSMEGGPDYIREKKWDRGNGGPIDMSKVYYINNGVDLYDFEYCKSNYTIDDSDLNDSQIKTILYIGSIRKANNVELLIDAAKHLQHIDNVKFLIYGDGGDRSRLEEKVKQEKITNVVFKDKWIEPKYVPYVVSQSTINILNYTKSFGTYGGSQSKLFQYMAAGKPICCNINMMYCQIKKYDLGVAQQFDNSEQYADAINSLLMLPSEEYEQKCTNAKNAALEFNYELLTNKFIDVIEKLFV